MRNRGKQRVLTVSVSYKLNRSNTNLLFSSLSVCGLCPPFATFPAEDEVPLKLSLVEDGSLSRVRSPARGTGTRILVVLRGERREALVVASGVGEGGRGDDDSTGETTSLLS